MLKKIDSIIIKIERGFSGVALLSMTLIVAFGVFSRELFGHTFSWIEEISQYMMVWIAFFGAILCVSENGHVGIDVIQNLLPGKIRAWWQVILDAVSCMFMFFLTRAAVAYTVKIHQSGQVSASLGWLPRSVLYTSAIIGCFFMGVEYAKLTARLIQKIRTHDYKQEEVPVEKLEHM